jgi:hypothetical protein
MARLLRLLSVSAWIGALGSLLGMVVAPARPRLSQPPVLAPVAGGQGGSARIPTRGGRGFGRSRWLAVGVALVAAGGLAAAAWAYWTATATAGSGGGSTASSVNQGPTPSVTVSTTAGRQVTISWGATTLSNSHAVDGYLVNRYPAAGGVGTINPFSSCTGTVTGLSCTETQVPPGSWKYAITPVIGTNWKGLEGTLSGAISVGAETFSISNSPFNNAAFTGTPATATATGPIGGFAANEGLNFRLDSTSGPVLAGTPASVATNGSASASVAVPKSSGEGGHSLYALGNATYLGNNTAYFPSQASAAIVVDTVAPTVSASLSPAANGAGWNNSTPVQVTLAASDPSPSAGNGTIKYTLDGSDPTSSGTAAPYAVPFNVSAQGTTTVKFFATDAVGNASGVVTQLVKIDTVPPTNSISLNPVSGNAILSGPTLWYRGVNAGSFTLTNAVTDALSGPASTGYANLSGSSTGWSFTTSSVSTPAGGPYVSNAFSWAASTSSSPTETVTGFDIANNSTSAPAITFTNDSTGPATGSVDATGLVGTGSRYSTSTTLSIALNKGTDTSGVGLAATGALLQRQSGTLSSSGSVSDGTCSYSGGFTTIATDPSSPYADSALGGIQTAHCYQYQYVVSDKLGNQTTYTSGDIKVDTSAPSAPTAATLTPVSGTGFQFVSGGPNLFYNPAQAGSFTVDSSSSDGQSGISQLLFPSLTGFSGGGAVTTPNSGTTFRTSYSWANNGASASPGAQSIVSSNNAALTATTASAFTVTKDATAPVTTDNTGTLGNGWKNSNQTVTLTPTDTGGAGVASTYYTTDGSTPTTSSAQGTTISLTGDGVYTIKYFSVDKVGNSETATQAGTQIRIDKTNPTPAAIGLAGAYVNGGTTYIKNGQALTDAATDPTVNGASSGVASVSYFYCAGGACTPSISIGTGSTGPNYSFAWSSQPADGVYTLRATVTDSATNTANSTTTVVSIDNTVPVTTDNTGTLNNSWKKTNQTVALSPTDPVTGTVASGVANTYYTSDGTAPTTSSTQGTSVALNGDGVYTVKYFSTDHVGNSETAKTAGTVIRIDETNPTPATLTIPSFIKNGAALTNAATDLTVNLASSGVASVQYLYCSGASCTPSTSIGTGSTGPNYSVAWSGQPADGVYRVMATVTDVAGNTANSNVVATTVDNTPPTNSLSLSGKTGGGSFKSGTTVFYQGSVAGSFQIQNAVADTLSGPASSATAALGGTSTGWTHAPSTVSTPSGGPYASNAFSWTTATSTAPTEVVTGADVAGNTTAAAALTLTNDSTAPVTTASLSPGANGAGWNHSSPVQVTLNSIETGSGLAQIKYTTDGTDPTNSGTAIVYTTPFNIASTTTVKYVGIDNVGNAETVKTQQVNIDTIAPGNLLTLTTKTGGGSFLAGNTLYYQGSTAGTFTIQNAVSDSGGSGAASSLFAALGGTATGWAFTGTTVSAPPGGPYPSNTFSWNAATSTAPTEVVTGADIAGNTTVAPTLAFANDSTAPTGGALTVNGGPAATSGGTTSTTTNTNFTITSRTNYSETQNTTQSGLASSTLTIQSETLIASACGAAGSGGPYTTATTITGTTNPAITAGFCYLYTLTGTDNLGNASSIKTTVSVFTSPTVTSTSPNSRGQGAASQVISVVGTGFVSGATSFFAGTGITVNSTAFVDATHLNVTITVAGNATVGAGNVTVTNPDGGTGTGTGVFTVNAGPTISLPSVATPCNPGHNKAGNCTITGTNFIAGVTVTGNGSVASVSSVTFVDSSHITVNVTGTGGNGASGSFTVTNPDGGTITSANGSFTNG